MGQTRQFTKKKCSLANFRRQLQQYNFAGTEFDRREPLGIEAKIIFSSSLSMLAWVEENNCFKVSHFLVLIERPHCLEASNRHLKLLYLPSLTKKLPSWAVRTVRLSVGVTTYAEPSCFDH